MEEPLGGVVAYIPLRTSSYDGGGGMRALSSGGGGGNGAVEGKGAKSS